MTLTMVVASPFLVFVLISSSLRLIFNSILRFISSRKMTGVRRRRLGLFELFDPKNKNVVICDDRLIKNLRHDLNLPSLPIIQVSLCSNCTSGGGYRDKVREAQLGLKLSNVVQLGR
ncbi:unnamed protein product [Arabidopsis halleri]